MKQITEELLRVVSDFKGAFDGAFNIRVDGECAGRQSSKNIRIESKKGLPGLEIHIAPGTKGEKVYIPACVTHSNIDDLVYNDFYVGEGADVTIVAGCGVHSDGEEEARHNGIHRFFLEKGAHVLYEEKHLGTGSGSGARRIDPVTDVHLAEDSSLEMDTVQLGGVDNTGHQFGWMTDKYLRALANAWQCVKQVKESLPQGYHLVVTADHGGHDRDHGLDIPEDMTIPLFFWGPAFAPGKELENVSIKDIAPTIAYLMGMRCPPQWEGRNVLQDQ